MHSTIFLIFFILFSDGKETSSQVSDYWIIENPSVLIIYNNYQHRLTEKDKSLLPKFSAWRIIDKDYTMSDQFTHSIQTEINKKIYFIQLSDDGGLVNSSLAGQIQQYSNAKVQGDTVRIINSGQLFLRSGDRQLNLTEGTLIQRVFIYGNKTYARDIAGNMTGWIEGNGPANWEIYHPPNSDNALKIQLFRKVDQIIKSYNSRMDKLFVFLNKQYNESKSPPQWVFDQSSPYLRYTIHPREYTNQFPGSESYLIQELNDLLYGSNYRLSATDGQIVISSPSR
jgi:hypothetical protein